MNQEKIIKALTLLAEYYGTKLSTNQLVMYSEDLLELTEEELILSIKKYRQNPDHVFFPRPAQLIGQVRIVESDSEIGKDIASRIIRSISEDGNSNIERAKLKIGEVGWEVVKRQGGWSELCRTMTEANKATMQAQLRDLAAVVHKRERFGVLHDPSPQLDHHKIVPLQFLKTLPKDEDEKA